MYTSAVVQLYCIVYCTQCLLSPLSHVHNCTQYSVRNVFTHPPELYNCTPVHNVFSHPMCSGDKSAGSAAAGAAAGDYTLVKKFSSFKYRWSYWTFSSGFPRMTQQFCSCFDGKIVLFMNRTKWTHFYVFLHKVSRKRVTKVTIPKVTYLFKKWQPSRSKNEHSIHIFLYAVKTR